MSNQSEADSPQSQDQLDPQVQKARTDAERGFRTEISAIADPDRRERLTKILDFIIQSKAPASTSKSRHGAFDYGLLVHCWMFYRVARSVAVGGLLEQVQELVTQYSEPVIPSSTDLVAVMANVNQSSILLVSLLHDLNKAIDLNGQPHYEPKILASGERSTAQPWQVTKNATTPFKFIQSHLKGEESWIEAFVDLEPAVSMRDGVISLAVAEKLSPGLLKTLSGDEKFAIAYHDGAYAGRTGLQGKETALMLVCHFADMIAARWIS